MAKKDEAVLAGELGSAAVGSRTRTDVTVANEVVTSVLEFNEALLGTTLRTIGAVSAMRAKVTGRAIDFVETSVQDVLRVVRDASQAEADLEAQWLQAVERIVGGGMRRVGGAVLALASVADARTTLPPSPRGEPARAQA